MKTFNRHKFTVNQLKKAYKRVKLIFEPSTPLRAKEDTHVVLDYGLLKIAFDSRKFMVKWNFMAFGGNRDLDNKGELDIELYNDGSWLPYYDNNVVIPKHLGYELYHRFREMGMKEDPYEYPEYVR